MLVSRRSPGKLISAGSWRGVRVQVCRRALPHFDSASGTVVSKNLGVSIVGRGPRAAHKKGREPVPAMRRSAGPPGGKAMWAPGSYASVPSARLPTSQAQQASSRATATLATQGRLPAAPRDSCLRRRRAVASSQRRFVNVNPSFTDSTNAIAPIAPTHPRRFRRRQAPFPASRSGARSFVR